jgi:hypothetical protein
MAYNGAFSVAVLAVILPLNQGRFCREWRVLVEFGASFGWREARRRDLVTARVPNQGKAAESLPVRHHCGGAGGG